MKKEKLRLKLWVRVLLAIICCVVILIFLLLVINRLSYMANECDNAKGSICTIYDIQKYWRTK